MSYLLKQSESGLIKPVPGIWANLTSDLTSGRERRFNTLPDWTQYTKDQIHPPLKG